MNSRGSMGSEHHDRVTVGGATPDLNFSAAPELGAALPFGVSNRPAGGP